jgi:hypothetical protein
MARCGECKEREAQRGGFCRDCRIRRINLERRKYKPTPALESDLRAAYRGRKAELSTALTLMERRYKWPRHAFRHLAEDLGIVRMHWRKWTREEDEYLREHAGCDGVRRVAKALRRSPEAVRRRAVVLGAATQGDGYSVADLVRLMGVAHGTVERWKRRGLFGPGIEEARISATRVQRFLRRHAHEYALATVEQTWFVSLVFGLEARH